MRPPRARFTVRRLMILVAVAAAVLGVTIARHDRFGRIAAHHQSEFVNLVGRSPRISFGTYSESIERRFLWHGEMRRKYERAARHPWLPVGPDPTEPKEVP